jgi:hypothetical protein
MLAHAQPHALKTISASTASAMLSLGLLFSWGLNTTISSIVHTPVAVAEQTFYQINYIGMIAWTAKDSIRIVDRFGKQHTLLLDSRTRIIGSDETIIPVSRLRVHQHVHVKAWSNDSVLIAEEIILN